MRQLLLDPEPRGSSLHSHFQATHPVLSPKPRPPRGPSGETRCIATDSTEGSQVCVRHSRAAAANCFLFSLNRDGTRSNQAESIPATPPAASSPASISSPRSTVLPGLFPSRAHRATCLARAAASSAEAWSPRTNPARNINPDAPRRASRGLHIYFLFQDGIPGTVPFAGQCSACRTFPASPIAHASIQRWYAARATPTLVRGSFRSSRRSEEHTSE